MRMAMAYGHFGDLYSSDPSQRRQLQTQLDGESPLYHGQGS